MLKPLACLFDNRKKNTALTLILFCFFSLKVNANATDIGLTPNHVFGLWQNINQATLSLASQYSDDAGWLVKLESEQTRNFSGKSSADVLQLLGQYTERLERLKKGRQLAASKHLAPSSDDNISPSVVFLYSGKVLDSLIETLLVQQDRNALISPYFTLHKHNNKSSSEVYALVDLAHRRIGKIMATASIQTTKVN